jgi:hypothetical protein
MIHRRDFCDVACSSLKILLYLLIGLFLKCYDRISSNPKGARFGRGETYAPKGYFRASQGAA